MPDDLTEQVRDAAKCTTCASIERKHGLAVSGCKNCDWHGYRLTPAAVARALELGTLLYAAGASPNEFLERMLAALREAQ